MTMSNLRKMIFVAAFAVAIFGFLVSRAVAATPVQIHLDHWANGGTVKNSDPFPKWVDGNLHKTNSHYGEGDFVPTRFVLDSLPTGSYTLTFQWLAAKPQAQEVKHAHDYLATFNQSGSLVTGVDPCLPRVQGGGNGPNICGLGNLSGDSSFTVPADPNLSPANGWYGAQAAGSFRMWNGTITGTSTSPIYTYTPSPPFLLPNATYNQITVFFDVVNGPKDVVLALGARLAVANDWDSLVTDTDINPNNDKNGACDINGAPYHWRYDLFRDGLHLQSGSRDRSIMCTGQTSLINVAKRCFVGKNPDGTDHEVFADPFGNDIPFTYSSPSTSQGGSGFGSLIGTDGDPYFDVVCGSSTGTNVSTGTYTVREQAAFPVPDPGNLNANGLGWELRSIVCTTTNARSTFKYLDATVSATDAFELGDRTAQITLTTGDVVTCTFFNYQAQMPLHKLINGEGAKCTNPDTGLANTDDTGIRPCTYTTAGLTLTDSDPRFTFDLYFTDPSTQRPTKVPSPPWAGFPSPALASAKVPPKFEAPGLIGVPLTLCEEPSLPYMLTSVSVLVTDSSGSTTTTSPAVYTLFLASPLSGVLALPPPPFMTAHTFPAGTYGCFNILLPSGTTKFEINADNKPMCTATQGGWGAPVHGNNPAAILTSNWSGGSLLVGDHAFDGSSNGFAMQFDAASNIVNYFPQGHTAGTLDQDYLNPVNPWNGINSTATSSGVFGGQVTALKLNLLYGGFLGSGATTISNFVYPGLGCASGMSGSAILTFAEGVLSGGTSLPANSCSSVSELNAVVDFLNNAFDTCTVDANLP